VRARNHRGFNFVTSFRIAWLSKPKSVVRPSGLKATRLQHWSRVTVPQPFHPVMVRTLSRILSPFFSVFFMVVKSSREFGAGLAFAGACGAGVVGAGDVVNLRGGEGWGAFDAEAGTEERGPVTREHRGEGCGLVHGGIKNG
jgi:hypothetical protein